MSSAIQPEGNTSCAEKNFWKRPGTTNKGKKYENMITTNIILHMVNMDKIKNFYVSSDDANFGAFDDVIIEIETDKGRQTKAVQLKHSNNPGSLGIHRLASEKGDFSILKYFKSFQEIKKKPQQCILFTNLKFKVSENTKFQLSGKDFYLEPYKTEIADDCLKISQDINYCHKFRVVEEENHGDVPSELQEFKTFLESFCLYTNQQSLEILEKSTANNFTKTFCSNHETFEKFVRIISEWDMLEGSKIKLDKKLMQRAIALCLLSPYVEHFTSGPVSDKRKLLREAICSFDITLLENTECDMVKELWDDLDKNIDIKELNRLRSFYRLSPNYICKIEDVDGNVLAQLLWLMEKCPLILKEHENIEKVIQLCPDRKFVLLGEGKWREWMKGRSVFQNLLHLKSEHNLYERVMQTFTISLQGKAALTLMDACGGNEEFLKNIIVNNLLEMIDSPCLIDGEKEVLPNPYIERYLSLNVIDIKYLGHVNRNTVVILNCADSSKEIEKLPNIKLRNIDDYLVEPECRTSDDPIFIISKNKCSESEFEKVCSKTPKIVHYFKFLKNHILEWVRSRGDVGDLQNYKLTNHTKNENEFWSSEFRKNINLVVGDPGMGKTELTKSLKNKCSSKFWTVLISPQEVNLLFKQSEECKVSDHVNLFEKFVLDTKYQSLRRLDKEFFKLCSDQARVFYVWDALDEISTKYLEDVSDLIVLLSEKGFMQCVTSRKHLKSFLEKKFNTFSLNISQFNEDEQEEYIRKRLDSIVSTDNIEGAVRKIKSSFAFIKHVDILGIPLQIFMLTEIVVQNNDKYLKLFGDSWLLTDLYHYFIEEKFNIFYRNKLCLNIQDYYSRRVFKSDKEKILTHYEKLAVDLIFSDCEDIKCQEDIDNTSYEYESIGITTGFQNNTPLFLHASFAEYLTAVYFSKNFQVIPADTFFDEKYDNVRFFFDMLLAKNSPVHIAVLYRNFNALNDFDDKILTSKDGGGRSALHLMCSWGLRHSRRTVVIKKKKRFSRVLRKKVRSVKYILDDDDYEYSQEELETREYLDGVVHLFNKCKITELDGLFQLSPLSYAIPSESLGAELELLQSGMLQTDQLYSYCDRINILYFSSIFGYDKAIKTVVTGKLSTYYDEVNFSCEQFDDTALMIASANGHTAVVECLLEQRAKINRANGFCQTPLHEASSNGHEKIVECLVKNGAKINKVNTNNETPLYAASENGHETIVEFLVTCGADINGANINGWTPLFAAASNGHERTVDCLVKSGAEVNRTTEIGKTPLYAASENGHETIVEFLVTCGADINGANINGWTPLFAAASNGHERTVDCLVKSGAEVNRITEIGETPLYAASENGHERTVDCLVKSGAEVNRITEIGETPLYAAASNGHERTVDCLVKSGAEVNRTTEIGETPLYAAASNGHERTVDCLVKSGAEVNRTTEIGETPLYAASENGHERTVDCLVKIGAEVNRTTEIGETPLYAAASNGHERTVDCLVKSGAEVNRTTEIGETPLYAASENGHETIVKFLVKSGAEINHVNIYNWTPLNVASSKGHENIVQYLVKCGAEITRADHDGWTLLKATFSKGHEKIAEYLAKCETEVNYADEANEALLCVASSNNPERIVEYLIKYKGEINRVDENGETLLYTASSNGCEKIVELLVKSGAEIDRANTSGMTPLYVASSKGNEIIIEYLVKCGTEINQADDDGKTPLYAAASNGHEKIVKLLAKCGGEVNCVDEDGKTPLFTAACNGHEKVVECLVKYGAEVNRGNNNGETPLYIASCRDHEEIVTYLTANGAKK
ncbi:uncharacterized protein LOC135138458 [Zophobas morio]|uniref:uncharacterized protein LOC135138458 n=1 Tax=Zophobas morio TaxID=2755281 RepID=UPI003082D034